MATNARRSENSIERIPSDAALIGIDTEGARHYVTCPIHDDVTIYVKEQSGDVRTWDLSETPYDRVGGPSVTERGWYDHVADKRGWDVLADEIGAKRLDAIARGEH